MQKNWLGTAHKISTAPTLSGALFVHVYCSVYLDQLYVLKSGRSLKMKEVSHVWTESNDIVLMRRCALGWL